MWSFGITDGLLDEKRKKNVSYCINNYYYALLLSESQRSNSIGTRVKNDGKTVTQEENPQGQVRKSARILPKQEQQQKQQQLNIPNQIKSKISKKKRIDAAKDRVGSSSSARGRSKARPKPPLRKAATIKPPPGI